jgi:hypothetical protein
MGVFSSKIIKQVITSSDSHFIFFLELTQRTLMVVLHEHGLAVVFLIFMGFTANLPSVCVCVCVCHSLAANINPNNTTFGVSKVCLM